MTRPAPAATGTGVTAPGATAPAATGTGVTATGATATGGVAAAPADLPDPRRWPLLTVVSLGQFMVLLDTTVVALALPSVQRDLHADPGQVEWAVTAYVLCFGGLMLLGGRLADRWGRRATLAAGVVLFALASAAAGLAAGPGTLVAARALQGVGAALLAPAALSTVTTSFPEGRERGTALGVFAALAGLGATLGVVVGGLVAEALSWRWIFYVNVPVGLLVLAGIARFAGAHARGRGRRGRPDVGGALLVTTGLTALVWAATAAGDGWTGPGVLLPGVVAAALLAGFVALELRVADPLVPIRRFSTRGMPRALAGRLLTAAVQSAVLLLGSFLLQRGLGYGPLRAGLAFLPLGVVAVLVTAVIPRLMTRWGPEPVYLGGAVASLAALAWWAWGPVGAGYVGYVLPALAVLGAAMQACTVPVNVVGVADVPRELHGVASAVLTASFQVGTSLGVALVAGPALAHAIAAAASGTGQAQAWVQGSRFGFALAAVVALANVVNAAAMTGRISGRRSHGPGGHAVTPG